jgi:membrane protein GlpM
MDIVIKSALGGLLIALLLGVARRGQYVVTGLLVSLPAVSLYTWWWVGREQGPQALRTAVRAAMWSAIPWVVYLFVVYLLAGRVPLWLTLLCGVASYLIVIAVFLVLLAARA